MYGLKSHSAIREDPTGRHVLSGKHRELEYKQSVAMLDDATTETRYVQEKLMSMVAYADADETLNVEERRELASKFFFSILPLSWTETNPV
jgi:hypothetical protein